VKKANCDKKRSKCNKIIILVFELKSKYEIPARSLQLRVRPHSQQQLKGTWLTSKNCSISAVVFGYTFYSQSLAPNIYGAHCINHLIKQDLPLNFKLSLQGYFKVFLPIEKRIKNK
jgi:hypothetical protein